MTRFNAFVAASLALLASACAENQESLIVINAPAWGDGCTVGAGGGDVGLPFGVLDVAFDTRYLMPALLLNNTSVRGPNNAGIETNEVQLLDADVDLSSTNAPEFIDALRASDENLVSFNVPLATVSILPGETQGVLVEVISGSAAVALRDEMNSRGFDEDTRITLEATIVFHASRSGNTRGEVGGIEAREFRFPIQVCLGCLIDCSGCDEGECPPDYTSVAGGICGNAQDLPVFPAACEAPE